MIQALRYIISSGFLFSIFGIFGFMEGAFIFPLIFLFSKNREIAHSRMRLLISKTFWVFIKIGQFLRVVRLNVDISNAQQVKGALIIANHPSLIDVIILIAHLGDIQCFVKSKLWKNPLIGVVVRGCNYIRNDADPQEMINNCKIHLKSGGNILIFPEGTRSIPNQPIVLSRGIGHLAQQTQSIIVGVTIACKPAMLMKGQKWYQIPKETVQIKVRDGRTFDINTFHTDLERPKRIRRFVKEIENYYNGFIQDEH